MMCLSFAVHVSPQAALSPLQVPLQIYVGLAHLRPAGFAGAAAPVHPAFPFFIETRCRPRWALSFSSALGPPCYGRARR